MLRTLMLLSLTAFCLLPTLALGQADNPVFLDRKIEMGVTKAHAWAFVHALSNTGVKVGFEATVNIDLQNDPIFTIRGRTVRTVLNSFVEQDPRYAWEVRDGVVNIYPRKDIGLAIRWVLNTPIESFQLESGQSKDEISDLITGVFADGLFKEKFSGYKVIALRASAPGNNDFVSHSFLISGKDLREILNGLARSGLTQGAWTISQTSEKSILVTF